MDVQSPASGRFHPSSWSILFSPGTSELPAENAPRRDPSVGMQTSFLRRQSASGQCASVSSHVCYELTETAGNTFGYVLHKYLHVRAPVICFLMLCVCGVS